LGLTVSQIQESFIEQLSGNLSRSLHSGLESGVLPQLEAACREAFAQVNSALERGVASGMSSSGRAVIERLGQLEEARFCLPTPTSALTFKQAILDAQRHSGMQYHETCVLGWSGKRFARSCGIFLTFRVQVSHCRRGRGYGRAAAACATR